MKKTEIFMNKPVYLGLSVLELSKILIHEFWYDYVKPKYDGKVKLYFMDAFYGFIEYIKTDDIYKDMAEDVQTRFDTWNYELDKPLPKGKITKVIGLMKDELDGKITIKLVGLRAKTYSYLIDDGSKDKIAKGTKRCVQKRKPKFENYKNCLKATQLENKISRTKNKINIDSFTKIRKWFIRNNKSILKTQQRFESERHNVFSEEINKIPLSSNDDKRIQSTDSIETYAYGASKDLLSEKKEIKCSKIIKQYKK